MKPSPKPIEEWRQVVGSREYEVSSFGRVRRIDSGRILTPADAGDDECSYPAVSIDRRRKKSTLCYVHQLVAEAFLGRRPRGHYIAFRDENSRNAAATNLEYVSAQVHQQRTTCRKLARIVFETILPNLSRETIGLVNELIPKMASISHAWTDEISITAPRYGHLDGFDELCKRVARYDLATLVRYCLQLERSNKPWTVLSSAPSEPKKK